MGLRTIFADVLLNLELAQAFDDERAEDKRGEKRRHAGECGAKGEVTEDAEGRKDRKKFDVEQPVEQSVIPSKNAGKFRYSLPELGFAMRSVHSCRARSNFTPRDALSNTASPDLA